MTKQQIIETAAFEEVELDGQRWKNYKISRIDFNKFWNNLDPSARMFIEYDGPGPTVQLDETARLMLSVDVTAPEAASSNV